MKLLGFTFNKISIERLGPLTEDLKVNNSMDISDIKTLKQEFFKSKEEFVGVKFIFILNYDPHIAKIEISGDIVVSVDSKTSREVVNEWKEHKKISDENFRIDLFNIILKKATLKAIQLEEELNLPIHISFPTLRKENEK